MNLPIRPFTSQTTFGVPVAPVWKLHKCSWCGWAFKDTGERHTSGYKWEYVFGVQVPHNSHGVCPNCFEQMAAQINKTNQQK